jgi:hypothetical protein
MLASYTYTSTGGSGTVSSLGAPRDSGLHHECHFFSASPLVSGLPTSYPKFVWAYNLVLKEH